MIRAQNPNIQILETAVDRLGDLTEEMVFLGGCATRPTQPPHRVPRDVDVITEVASLAEYYQLSERLRLKGFAEDQSLDAPICRWVAPGLVLDVMPTDEKILSFGNEWYRPAMTAATKLQLPSGQTISMVTAPYFLATKLVAFDSRGQGDFMISHDIEDLVAVLDGRPELTNEVLSTDDDLRRFLAKRFGELLSNQGFLDALPGHLLGGAASPDRTPVVLRVIREISEA